MTINRRDLGRAFAGSAAALASGALAPQRLIAAPALPAPPASLDSAIGAIEAYAAQHVRYYNLPALTVGLAVPGGGAHVRHFGYADLGARTAINDRTLFQIGSISKLLSGALVHQFAAEGKVRLGDPIAALMPELGLLAKFGITVQQLLDHVSGLPADAPLFPDGGLWTGFKAGAHWSYSNTGYDIIGKLVEHVGGKPLDRLLEERLFAPLNMRDTFGAITADQRDRYAQGYEASDSAAVYVRGTPLAPAGWVDVTFAAGSTASTARDMIALIRSLIASAQGRGGMGLGPVAGLAFARHSVATGTPAMRYGNGLMHVPGLGGRDLLHHTGGMVSFSSAFHADPLSGAGAFASSSLSAFAAYRPRALTLFAVNALAAVKEGRPLPQPAPLSAPIGNAAEFAGQYSGPSGAFEIRARGTTLEVSADGQTAPLEPTFGDVFRTLHPRFRHFSLLFERTADKKIGGVSWGPASFVRAGSGWTPKPANAELARLAGRFVNDSPWLGMAEIVERGGRLWFGTETPLTSIGPDLFRLGDEDWSPERVRFANSIDGRPQTMVFSGEKFIRHDI